MSWLLAFLGFALLVILHEFGHFTAAKLVGMRVERFALFFPPLLFKKKFGETEYAIGSIPAGGYVKITGMNPDEDLPEEVRTRAYHAQPVWKRIVVIAAGPAVNLVVALVLLVVYFGVIGPREATQNIERPEKGYPAATALQADDKIVSVDGKTELVDFAPAISAHKCTGTPVKGCEAANPAKLVIERDGKRRALSVKPIYDAARDRTRLGFTYQAGGHDPLPFGEAVSVSLNRFWFITRQTVSIPARIIDPEQRKEISGIVGSYEVTRQTIIDDLSDAVALMAIISLSLAIVNLFPFLPLDGGHIFWAVVEKVRRRPVSYATMERAGVVGFMLVIMLFAIGLTNDIGRLTGEGFDVR